MKQLFLITALHLVFLSSFAQPPRPDRPNRPEPRPDYENRAAEMKKIQAMEMAFITKELDLNPEEAQKFWPVFNQYRSEIKTIAMDRKSGDQLEKQQKMLDLRKKYREDFTKVLNQERANRVFGAEEEFRSMVRKEFQKKQMEKRQVEQRKNGF
jgi:hypothetical protein